MTSSKISKTPTTPAPPDREDGQGQLSITTLNTSDLTKDLNRFSLTDTFAELADLLDTIPDDAPEDERPRVIHLRYNPPPRR